MALLKELIQDIALESIEAHTPVELYDGLYLGKIDGIPRAQLEQGFDVAITVPQHLTDWKIPVELDPMTGAVSGNMTAASEIAIGGVPSFSNTSINKDINKRIAQTQDYAQDPSNFSGSGSTPVVLDFGGRVQGTLYFKNHLNIGDHILVARYHKEKKYVALARLAEDVT